MLIRLNYEQSNDVLVNLVKGVNFLRKCALKVALFFKCCYFSLYGCITKNWHTSRCVLTHFFILESLIPFATPKCIDECLGSILRYSKQEGEKRKLQRTRKEAFIATCVIYIEPLTSRPPPRFQKKSKSSRKERIVERIFEALQHVTTMGGFEKTL
jgi:hypothetical protein